MDTDNTELRHRIEEFLEDVNFDVTSIHPDASDSLTQDALLDLLVRTVVGLCTAWWSMRELFDYMRNRDTFADIVAQIKGSTADRTP